MKLMEVESRMMVTRDGGKQEMGWGSDGQRVPSFSCARYVSSGDLIYSTVPVSNNTMLYS